MNKFENFVLLGSNRTNGPSSTFLVLLAAEAPFRNPPDPSPGRATLAIVDNLRSPTKVEIIAYAGVELIGSGEVELKAVERGQQGTTAQNWLAGQTFVVQDVTAADLAILELQERSVFVYGSSVDTTVRKIDPGGNEVWVFSGHEDDVRALATDLHGNVYSGDSLGQIKKINDLGVEQWNADFTRAADLVSVSNSGDVIVAGGSGGVAVRISSFSPSGSLNWTIDATSSLGLASVQSLSVDQDGRVILASSSEIVVLSSSGDTLAVIAEPLVPVRLTIGSDGFIYYFRGGASSIVKMAVDGGEVWEHGTFIPGGAIAHFDGRVYASESFTSNIKVLDADDGSLIETIALAMSAVLTIKVGADGFIYTMSGDRIMKSSLSGAMIWEFNSFFGAIFGMDVSPYGPELAVKYGEPPALGRITYADVAEKPLSQDALRLKTAPVAPATPPTGQCVIYFDGTDIIAKFDNGTTAVIASKT